MKFFLPSLVVFLFILSLTAKAGQLSLKVNATAIHCDVRVDMEMSNETNSNLTFDKNNLPWANSLFGASLLVQEISPARGLLKQIYGIADDDSVVRLASKEKLKGSFYLRERFPNLIESLKKNNYVFYWNYTLMPQEYEVGVVNVGAILLKKCDSSL